ncbi:MAG: M48 family metalloprotease [Gammaproteobacteria bacterium]|nr:M48 family metalloprotease [Gammaproteobacteria bacterium]
MNFFAQQDRARNTTRKLVFLFSCAVISLIFITSLLIIFTISFSEGASADIAFDSDLITSNIFILVSLGVIAVVTLGSLFRLAQLRGGGRVVAEAMGGRLLNTGTRDADERKVLNVVEEIAIASGTPVPPVYLMEDTAINAFAAGYKAQDAVIGVTRGCVQQLNRDELQGVIAHEFSHIFNGDMRLNIRLMGLLYGIMVIGLIGYYIVRGSVYRGHSSRSNKKGGGIVILGIGLLIVGYGGTFFGNIIKAAVSRQREFLADASAVQFTRNPDGISGALKKIGGYKEGSTINSADASEISHMLFSQGLKTSFTGLFATHPPLKERISKIDPYWHGDFIETAGQKPSSSSAEKTSGFSAEGADGSLGADGSKSAIDSIGEPGYQHIELAANNLSQLPDEITEDAHSSFGACMLMHCLLMELASPAIEKKQLAILEQGLSPRQYSSLLAIKNKASWISRDLYLTLIDLCLPALKQLSAIQYRTFMSHLSQLIVADEHVSVFEWCIFKILRYNLDQEAQTKEKRVDLKAAGWASEALLSVLSMIGNSDVVAAENAFNNAQALLSIQQQLNFKAEYKDNTEALEKATDLLKDLKPLQKPRLLKAMASCINADGIVSPEEAELLRAVASLLDCPIPPLLNQQKFI